MDATATLKTIQSWPAGEQLEFLFRAWDQFVDDNHSPELTDEVKAELHRRLQAHEADPSRVRTWQQMEAHVRRPR